MDDLQFRRAIYSDPKSQDEELLAAMDKDPNRQKIAHDMSLLDEKIKQALQVPVPDDLCNKLILRQTLATHQQHKRKKRLHLAMAASVAILGALFINYLQFNSAYNNLGDYSLAHVYHEAEHFADNGANANSRLISLASLNSKMATFNGNFTDVLGKLIFADYCRFGGMKSLHLVYQGKTSPVNVFIVPKDDQMTFIDKFSDQHLFGESAAFNQANVIVVGDKSESLNQWQDKLSKNINWTI
ncbi:DUF3379 domain-containing protein [Colwellia asteriadis]|uniref:DUF3379 domain-containing protein n=1 Tax=Colwellia asteriadis TaxID=517723 RepID=A0ABN1LAT8_9GAMM